MSGARTQNDINSVIRQHSEWLATQLHAQRESLFPPDAAKEMRKFTSGEAATLLGVGDSYLRKLHLDGRGPVPETTAGNRRLYSAADIQSLRSMLETTARRPGEYLPRRRDGDDHGSGQRCAAMGGTIMKIGFIGLGNMGAPMAVNLAKAGHTVKGFDVAGTTSDGVQSVSSATEAAADADVVITMLPNGDILRAVAADVIPAMPKGATLIDCSTVDVDSARAVAAQAQDAGLLCVDAPVSGGIGGASGGTLTFMAGGSPAAFAVARPLFDIMGQKAVHCGEAGAGQAAKICNNMILGATMIVTCEAFALADKLGLDRQKMFDVVSTSSGYSWSMNAYCPAPGIGPQSPADNGYAPGFAAELMLKDLGLSQQAAEAADADTPMGARALELYRQFVEEEDGKGRDFSAMLPRLLARGRG